MISNQALKRVPKSISFGQGIVLVQEGLDFDSGLDLTPSDLIFLLSHSSLPLTSISQRSRSPLLLVGGEEGARSLSEGNSPTIPRTGQRGPHLRHRSTVSTDSV